MFAQARHRAGLPLAAIAILAVLAFTAFTSLRPTHATPDVVGTAQVLPLRALPADNAPCGGAYVTGDLVGDASPATVYATMCEGR